MSSAQGLIMCDGAGSFLGYTGTTGEIPTA